MKPDFLLECEGNYPIHAKLERSKTEKGGK